MLNQICRFADDLEESFKMVTDVRLECDNIVVCGMGGSAVSGDIISDICFDIPDVKIEVIRYPLLPGWVNEKSLVLICSYSGNTWETKSMYEEAVKRGCKIIVISSGGDISEIAAMRDNILLPLPENVQPRQAIGLMVGYIGKIIDLSKGTNLKSKVNKSLDGVREFDYHLRNGEDNVAKRLADRLYGKIPVIYSDSSMSSVSFRWKTQISENSKMVAFDCLMPEFNHNELVGWAESFDKILAPVLISFSIQPESVREVTDACLNTLNDYGTDILKVDVPGSSRAECILKGIVLGDYVSYFLAMKNKVNPLEVHPIKTLKVEIQERREFNDKSTQETFRNLILTRD